MKLVSALVGLAALGGVALSSAAASATPIDVPAASTVVPAGYVCNEWGHCGHRHWGGGYYHPQRWGGYSWHRHWGGGYGWHHPGPMAVATAGARTGVAAGVGITGTTGATGNTSED